MAQIINSLCQNNILARPGQPLCNHATNVALIASSFAEKFGLATILQSAGFLHDLGKSTPEFQEYLFDSNAKRGSVEHSALGAKNASSNASDIPHIAELLANTIASHHGLLYDYLTPHGDTPLHDKLDKTVLIADDSSMNLNLMRAEFNALIDKISNEDKAFGLSMITKLAYSCLVDADRLDAYHHEIGVMYSRPPIPDWDAVLSNLTHYLNLFNTNEAVSDITTFRKHVSDSCGEAGNKDRGIYKLEVPTGGGKTLASLRFALEHAKKHGLERIIYVIPYLSILSQTAKAIREALSADEHFVLEHHSNFLPDEPEHYKLNTDRWDAPIILTTQVQFLESIFSARGSDLRKLHHMANSILIFDEVQSLPVNCIHLFNSALHFLNHVCGSTMLLCTATQPLLDTVPRKLRFSQNSSIVTCGPLPKRNNICNAMKPGGYSYTELAAFVMDKHRRSTLIIVNTKAAAKFLYEELKQNGEPVLHLSTSMCGIHRDKVIEELRRRLRDNEPVLCVSTQLIEAGVDISLECVIRDVAGLDSIYQAAGRCNRHGEFGETKNVYVINIAGENLSKLPDIKIGAEITMRLFAEGSAEDLDAYYQYYFYARKDIMDYPIKGGGSIYDLLASNAQGRGAYKNRKDKFDTKPPALLAAIRSAAEAFYIIERGGKDVIVPYGEALELVEQYTKSYKDGEKRELLRKLGRFSVTLYPYQIEYLDKKGVLCPQEGLVVLEKGFYDSERGVDLEGQKDFLII